MDSEQAALEAIDHLSGSCEALWVEYSEYEDDDKFLAILDESIFNCVGCGWWYPVSELNHQNGEYVCEECFDGEG